MLGDRRPTMEDVQALRFTTRVLNESMRLYPQPPVLIRRALADDVLYGYKVRALSRSHLSAIFRLRQMMIRAHDRGCLPRCTNMQGQTDSTLLALS